MVMRSQQWKPSRYMWLARGLEKVSLSVAADLLFAVPETEQKAH